MFAARFGQHRQVVMDDLLSVATVHDCEARLCVYLQSQRWVRHKRSLVRARSEDEVVSEAVLIG